MVIATGGAGQVYQYTTNPSVTTGDGIALAAKAGCRIKDMEFIQFHPTAFAKGKSPLFLISETVRGEGGILKNAKHEAFMGKYHPSKDLAPRDIISRAIFVEQKKGQVYLDITHKPKSELKKHFPTIYKYLAKHGLAMEKDLIPIAPAAHYTCGGVETDVQGKTDIQNLFVVGEAACTGLHGANRLASNSLLEAAVMSEHVMDSPLSELKDFEEQMQKYSLNKVHTINNSTQKKLKKITQNDLKKISQLRKKLQEIMWKNAGIVRTKKMLGIGLQKIEQIKRSTSRVNPSTKKIELENMIVVSRIIVASALKRKKSLGAHYRLN